MKKSYWDERAVTYNNLLWAKDDGLLSKIISIAKPQISQIMLDVGTGTGIMAKAFSPLVRSIDAIDISPLMLEKAQSNGFKNINYLKSNILDFDFVNSKYDLVIARMVFHHIINANERRKAVENIYYLLKNDGKLIIIEDIPPNKECKKLYDKIFKLKEKRISFLPADLRSLMKTQFPGVDTSFYFMENSSITNWLNANNLNADIQREIKNLYRNADKMFKDSYRMKETNSDIFLTRKFAIVIGTKQR